MCSWFPLCDNRRRADDHLSLVAGISRNQRKALAERGREHRGRPREARPSPEAED